MEIKKKERGVYAVDLDGTLCEGAFWDDNEPKPKTERIKQINDLYKKGNIILIYTARDSIYFQTTFAWLIKHGVMHHGINMKHKPGADIYIDDKGVSDIDFFNEDSNKIINNKGDNPDKMIGKSVYILDNTDSDSFYPKEYTVINYDNEWFLLKSTEDKVFLYKKYVFLTKEEAEKEADKINNK